MRMSLSDGEEVASSGKQGQVIVCNELFRRFLHMERLVLAKFVVSCLHCPQNKDINARWMQPLLQLVLNVN